MRSSPFAGGPWAAALEMTRERPLLGFGPGTFGAEYVPHRLAAEIRAKRRFVSPLITSSYAEAHSDYLQVASDAGVPAALLAVGSLGCLLAAIAGLRVAAPEPRGDGARRRARDRRRGRADLVPAAASDHGGAAPARRGPRLACGRRARAPRPRPSREGPRPARRPRRAGVARRSGAPPLPGRTPDRPRDRGIPEPRRSGERARRFRRDPPRRPDRAGHDAGPSRATRAPR